MTIKHILPNEPSTHPFYLGRGPLHFSQASNSIDKKKITKQHLHTTQFNYADYSQFQKENYFFVLECK